MVEIVHEHEQPEAETEVLAPAQVFDPQTLALLQKNEIDQQIATAKRYPRKITQMLSTAASLVTADAETADECIYALPRGGKIIEGPSVRFAEVMAYSWGNCRCGARVIGEDEEFVTSQGTFFDLEANVAVAYEVRRRVTDRKGNRYNSDMITVTSNAACSIALRNAILRGIPKAIWRKVYAQARLAVAGDIKTLDTRRVAMLKAFELMGVKREMVFAKLEIKGVDDITLDHLVTLRGIYNAVREHEMTADKAFAPELPAQTEDTNLANKSKNNLEKIKEKYAQPEGEVQPPADPARTEKLRKEATRQKKAVAEKYGAPSGTQGQEPAPAKAEDTTAVTAAPSDVASEGGDVQSSPAPEGPVPAGAGAGPDEKQSTAPAPAAEESHGIPHLFDSPDSSAPEKE